VLLVAGTDGYFELKRTRTREQIFHEVASARSSAESAGDFGDTAPTLPA